MWSNTLFCVLLRDESVCNSGIKSEGENVKKVNRNRPMMLQLMSIPQLSASTLKAFAVIYSPKSSLDLTKMFFSECCQNGQNLRKC